MIEFDIADIKLAHSQGTAVGQVALAEYLLKAYMDDLTPMLKRFLQKVCDDQYDFIGENTGKSGEDVALKVGQLMEKIVP